MKFANNNSQNLQAQANAGKKVGYPRQKKRYNQPYQEEADNNDNNDNKNFGTLPLIQSQQRGNRVFHEVKDLNEKMDKQNVYIRGRIHNTRGKGLPNI